MPRHDAVVIGEFELSEHVETGDTVRRTQHCEGMTDRSCRVTVAFYPDDRTIVEATIPFADAYFTGGRRERPRAWCGVTQGGSHEWDA